MKTAPVAPAMQFPFKQQKKGHDVSTYDVEGPEMQSLALMESLEAMKNAQKETLGDDEFMELDDIEKMMTTKSAPKKINGKKKSKK